MHSDALLTCSFLAREFWRAVCREFRPESWILKRKTNERKEPENNRVQQFCLWHYHRYAQFKNVVCRVHRDIIPGVVLDRRLPAALTWLGTVVDYANYGRFALLRKTTLGSELTSSPFYILAGTRNCSRF